MMRDFSHPPFARSFFQMLPFVLAIYYVKVFYTKKYDPFSYPKLKNHQEKSTFMLYECARLQNLRLSASN